MKSRVPRLILATLCLVLAFGAPLSRAFGAEQPCGMSGMSHDAGMSDCDCGGDEAAKCAQHCAAVFAGFVLQSVAAPEASFMLQDGAVAALPSIDFESRAGPPRLQPPR
jgi:hypothetical protein